MVTAIWRTLNLGFPPFPTPGTPSLPAGTDRLRRWALALLPGGRKGRSPEGSGDTCTTTEGTFLGWANSTGLKLVSGISRERREGRIKANLNGLRGGKRDALTWRGKPGTNYGTKKWHKLDKWCPGYFGQPREAEPLFRTAGFQSCLSKS